MSFGLVMVDPGQLDQVLLNLTLNARDAMRLPLHLNGEPRGPGGQLTIETAHVMLDDTAVSSLRTARFGPHVLLTVRDTGVGMNAETQCHIFEPFFTTKEVGQGTGLGLAMVEGFVTQSGGAIVVASEPGQGTTFTIYWPHMEGAVASSQAEAPQAAWPRGQDTILLVDDDDTIQLLVHRVLAASGYTVLDASTPVEALQIGLQYPHTIHLLLTDVVMPGMSGRELSDRLTPVRPGMKVLYMSGYTDDDLVSHSVQAEGRAFLPKPFTPQVLTSTVRAVLDDMCDGGLSHGG
jgi:CheY-like chemotaxis protein